MPDDLYDRDILTWSEHQAGLLRRLSKGERVNGLDWAHLAEEIEDVGLSELNAVRSFVRLLLVHLLKIQDWPDSPSLNHWRGEIGSFQADASQRFAPSMRQRIDLASSWSNAVEQLESLTYDGVPPRAWPSECSFTLSQLLSGKRAELEHLMIAAATGSAEP